MGNVLYSGSILTQNNASAGYALLRTLVGEWQMQTENHQVVKITYELVSDESVLLERMKTGNEPEMITMYHSDGANLMLTHYCSVKNQLWMLTEKIDKKSKLIRFNFKEATNLSNPEMGHMQRLSTTFLDENHMTQEWTRRPEGQEVAQTFALERIR